MEDCHSRPWMVLTDRVGRSHLRHVYVLFGNVGLFAYEFDGTPAWSTRIDPKPTRNGWGTGASPALFDGRLYVIHDNEISPALLAIDASNGKVLWRIAPSPFSRHRLLYVSSGYVGDSVRPVYAIKPGARGNISLKPGETSNSAVAWSLPQGGTYNTSPIVYGDYYYTLFDRGFFTCHDARTGKEIYTKVRLDPAAGAFTASPWAYDGKLFAMSEDGVTYVIQAGPEYKLLRKNTLDEFTMASPAIHLDSIVIRTATTLYRIAIPVTP